MLCLALLVVLLLTGTVQPWFVVALSLIVGITDALSMPSFSSIVPTIVKRDQIASALALNATQFNLSRILGPAIAGVLMASVGAVACFAPNAASYLPFIWVVLWVLPRRDTVPARTDPFDYHYHYPLAGVRQIAGQRHLRSALLTTLVTSTLCARLIIFCPVLVKEVLHGDVSDFSLAIGAFGVGGLLAAAALLGVDAERDRRRLSSRFAGGWRDRGPGGGQPVVLGLAGAARSCWTVDEREQYFGQFFLAGYGAIATARPDRQSLYARDARRALDRRAYDRYFDRAARRALCLTNQWNSGADDAAFCRARMDMCALAEGFDIKSQSSSCLLRLRSGRRRNP